MALIELPLLTYADFKGDTPLTLNTFEREYLDEIIFIYEQKYIRELFSDKLYLDLKDGIDDSNTIFKTLLIGGEYTYNGNTYICDGIKEILRYFVYYEVRKIWYESNHINKSDNSNVNTANMYGVLQLAWNKAVEKYKNTCQYIVYNIDGVGYEDFKQFKLPVVRILNFC